MKKVLVYVIALFVGGTFLFTILSKDLDISISERRKLEQFPTVSLENITSGRFMDKFESYATDQVPNRDAWRSLKAQIVQKVFGQSDNNLYYKERGHISKIEYPLNEDSVLRATKIFNRIYEENLKEQNCKVYYSVIPDKNYFLGRGHLQMDYDRLGSVMKNELAEMTYIDIMDMLDEDDYYYTDTHWKQENLIDVAEKLAHEMGNDFVAEYETNKLESPFYGVYSGQSALQVQPDELCYITNDTLENCKVYDYQNEKEIPIYDVEKAEGKDPYEMFLSGSLSLITISNPMAENQRELVLFRDSFGSSIAPLLVEGYSKITLVDIRYLSIAYMNSLVDFENADVLFLYSTSVLNHSETLK